MERKNVLRLTEVLTVGMDLCEAVEKEPYEIVGANPNLIGEDGKINRYATFLICRKSKSAEAKVYIDACHGMKKKDFIGSIPYHHISTFLESRGIDNFISFDQTDDVPIKFGVHPDDKPLYTFLTEYNEVRNAKIDRGEEIGYYDMINYMNEFFKRWKKEQPNVLQKIKRKIFNRQEQ